MSHKETKTKILEAFSIKTKAKKVLEYNRTIYHYV